MQCHHFEAGRCRSCTWLDQPYVGQVGAKQAHCRDLLAPWPEVTWLPPVTSAEVGFRNKAKMVVAGSVDAPSLGILDPVGGGVDLRDCPLHVAPIRAALPVLAGFVTRARLAPYDVPARRGELKHLLVTASPEGELMVRFVLRSTESLARIRKHLPWLREHLPALRVAGVNLQPAHKAVLEGEQEVLLTAEETLRMRVNGLDLHLRPQSFFQTNTEVAAALYRQGRAWIEEVGPRTMWDLYCGVGGFALHGAGDGRRVLGVETSAEAVASATRSASEAGLDGVRFAVGDATAFALSGAEPTPELVVVNPPRRGIGTELAGWLEASTVEHVVYSSCNAATLARDLAAMPTLRPVRARVLDMFPQTGHYEVIVLLERAAPAGSGPA
ncbi:23S rRNA (uracil(747)-C(5))-methyltransferase RlmC [Nocardioides pantholopis]|uniref:23S rRNA (uracil(747)-C(5))-methyltransferase RlmC n=1 Tax=Nocardioides pantholopis TaxID=2483798 RepID=UPI000FDBC630|nr:23S rRNA (uracil(747)-C(5))-methyltransferase RlmC [Nocardioides pantholopis]